jgi:opacity protein-like surface antigen
MGGDFRMPVFDRRSVPALVLAALCLAGRAVSAQGAEVTYSSWPVGFHSELTVGQDSSVYGSLAGFDRGDARGLSWTRTDFSNGWFVGGGSAPTFGLSGLNQASALGTSLQTDGVQFGYKFQNGLPVALYAGFDTLRTGSGLGSNPLAPFDSTSATLPVYRAHAGVEFQPAPNLSLSLGVGYTQAPSRLDSELNSPLPGAFPFGRR